MSTTHCRFYENKYPEVDEVVMVNVQQIEDMGAYVKLLEYDNIEGMVLLSELSRRRIRSIQKLIRVGKNEVVVVLRVDREKGYIDLSKRRVSTEEVIKCEERYNKSKAVHSILRHCAEKFDVPLESLYEKVGWPLSRKFGHSYDAFKISITDENVWNDIEAGTDPKILAELKSYISRRLTPRDIKIRAEITVSCFGYDGIEAIKRALKAGEALSTEEMQVRASLVAAPLYALTTKSLDKQQGIDRIQNAIEVITEEIEKSDGACKVDMAPKAVTATEDQKLKELMDAREREQEDEEED